MPEKTNSGSGDVYYLEANQLIRVREIFGKFFRVLNDTCLSHSIYKCTIQGNTVNGERLMTMEFVVTDIQGAMKTELLAYSVDRDVIFYSDKFEFEEGSDLKILDATRKVLYGLETVDKPLNRIEVENGSRWVMGVIGPDLQSDNGGCVMFLKSELVFDAYSIDSKYRSSLETYVS